MPRPRCSFPGAGGWFAQVPAYRLATLRVALAVTTIVFHVPKFNGLIREYLASDFHVPPAFAWIPALTWTEGAALIVLQYLAACGLLVGLLPRVCAWFLAAAGFYIIALDPEHYAHNAQFHLTLLALVGCSGDRVSLVRLLQPGDGDTCPAWPERLVRIQLSIVFFYAALDKVFSPFWGMAGTLLTTLDVAQHGTALTALVRINQAVMREFAAPLGMLTIAIEFSLAVAFLLPRLWPAGLLLCFAFLVYLEFLVRPGLFTWDALAALVMFVPASDHSWTIEYHADHASCRLRRRLLEWLDWLRRVRWVPSGGTAAAAPGLTAVAGDARPQLLLGDAHGRVYSGLRAIRLFPVIFPGPVFVVMVLARFGGGFLSSRGYGHWDDLPFFMLGGLLVLWIPGVGRFGHRARLLDMLRAAPSVRRGP